MNESSDFQKRALFNPDAPPFAEAGSRKDGNESTYREAVVEEGGAPRSELDFI